MINWRSLQALALFAAMGLFLIACGDSNLLDSLADDSSAEAALDKCDDALDGGNDDEAIDACLDALADVPNDMGARANLAAAYASKGGLDYSGLIQAIDDAQKTAGDESASALYDAVVEMFGTVVGEDSAEATNLEGKSENFEKALDVLAPEGKDGRRSTEGLDDNDVVTVGIYAAAQVVTLFSEIAGVDDISEKGLKAHGNFSADLLAFDAETADTINDNLMLLLEAETVLTDVLVDGDNELADDLDTFLTQIGFDGDNDVSAEDMANYLNTFVARQ